MPASRTRRRAQLRDRTSLAADLTSSAVSTVTDKPASWRMFSRTRVGAGTRTRCAGEIVFGRPWVRSASGCRQRGGWHGKASNLDSCAGRRRRGVCGCRWVWIGPEIEAGRATFDHGGRRQPSPRQRPRRRLWHVGQGGRLGARRLSCARLRRHVPRRSQSDGRRVPCRRLRIANVVATHTAIGRHDRGCRRMARRWQRQHRVRRQRRPDGRTRRSMEHVPQRDAGPSPPDLRRPGDDDHLA